LLHCSNAFCNATALPPYWVRIQGGTFAAAAACNQEILAMFSSLVQRTRDSIQKRRRYNRLVAEIESLSDRDFADLNSSRGEMLYQVRRDIYGR
jgi:hypothetical protein